MKRPNITAGEWTACPGLSKQRYRIETRGTGNDCEPVATLTGPDRDANARFIAAAPDMAKALERLLACPDLAFDAMEPESLEAMAEARAALTKAGYEFP